MATPPQTPNTGKPGARRRWPSRLDLWQIVIFALLAWVLVSAVRSWDDPSEIDHLRTDVTRLEQQVARLQGTVRVLCAGEAAGGISSANSETNPQGGPYEGC